ncbi:MAG: hypothetical protein ACOVRN_16925 [Flavobacterium sp.]
MSTTEIRDIATDQYIVLTQYDASNNLEVALTQALVQSAYAKTTIDPLSTTYTSPANNSTWNTVDISNNWPAYITTSAISNYPAGTVTEYSVISSELITTDVSTNSYTTNISSTSCANNEYTFQTLNTSAPYYDANYIVAQSLIAGCVDNQSGIYVSATFDVDAANAKIQYAMQSRWNTTTGPYTLGLSSVGPDPTAMTQDTNLNTEVAFAKKGSGATDASYVSYWCSVNASNGSLLYTEVDASYQPVQNNLLVRDRDISNVTLDLYNDVGIFRIQQASAAISTQVKKNGGPFTVIQTNDLNNMPLFDGYGQDPSGVLVYDSSKNLLRIPGNMNFSQYATLFDIDVYNTIADEWSYLIDISANDAGYNLLNAHPLMSDLNNSNLLDNPYYMANYVNNEHSINFSSSTVVIDASTNGTSTDASSITVDLTNGETLDAAHAGVDGQIIMNTNTYYTRYTDLSNVDLGGNFTPGVRYQGDVGIALSIEETTNPYFKGMWQKVAQNSQYISPDYYLKTNNNAIMTLHTIGGGIVDNSYDPSDFDFSFNNGLFGSSTDIQLWKITGSNNIIVNPQSFYSDANYTTPETGIATTGIVTGLIDDLSYNNYRILLSAKEKEDIGLYQAVQDASGWDLTYTAGTYLYSSAAQAYSKSNLPIYDSNIISAINAGTDLPFSYTYKTIQDASSAGGLSDYVDISYNYNGADYVVTINQTDINRVYNNAVTDVSMVIVDPSLYEFTGSLLNKTSYQLVSVTANSEYDATFLAHFGPFTNIQLTVNNILQTDAYYAVQNKSTTHLLPQSILQYVVSPSITDLRVVYESISPSPGNSLSISGTFTADDLKPFRSMTQGQLIDLSWINLGPQQINTDVYYGLINNETIDGSASVLTTIQYTPFSNSINSSINVDLELLNYYIPFIYDQSGNVFTLQSFTASTSTLGANTTIDSASFLANTSYLSVTNAYNNVTWLTTQYNLEMTFNPVNSSTTFTAKNLGGVTVFSITALNRTIFLGTYLVSYIPQDYYRVERLLGASDISNTYLESFVTANYGGGLVDLQPTLQGVNITSTTDVLSNTVCPNLGSYQSFRVLGDFMNINEVGPTTPPTSTSELGISSYNNGSLVFQYQSGSNYSAVFTFPKYRGYKSYLTSNPDEYYVINRDATVATFNVDGSGIYTELSDTLTSNMYYQEAFVVNALRDLSNNVAANLNVTGSFNYSIPPTGSTLTYPVTVTGDSVSVTISNANYIGDASNIDVPVDATPVVDPKTYSDSMTLKDYGRDDVYTFSGNWYLTDRLMAIRPSRVKLNNAAYPFNTFQYKISNLASTVGLYKAINTTDPTINFNWLGNPALHGDQDPENAPSMSDWELVTSIDPSAIYQGIDIGRKTIYQDPNATITFRIVYIISVPPYYDFEQISTESCPVIPYAYNTQYTANQTTRYMPYLDPTTGSLKSGFNPFVPSTVYTDINGNATNVTSDPDYLNNVIFLLNNAPSITDAVVSPDATRYGIIVPGTNITVSLYSGLYNSTNPGAHTNPIWSGPVTSIPSTPDINNNALLFRGRDASGVITFSALQYPADIGYPSGESGYEQIFRTDVSSNWYNIDFKMGNTSWFNDNTPVTYFNVEANGIRPTMYTVVDVNNPITQINKRRVYKYTTNASIDIDISGASITDYQTFNLTFNARSYHDFDISRNNVFPGASGNIWKYNDLLNQTVIANSAITWTVDASYTDTAYVSWAFGNSTTATQMLNQLFAVQDNQQKWVYIQLKPFMRYMNQFNMQVGSIAWDGSVTAPLVSTRVLELAPALANPILQNVTYATQQYSESTL